jgi:MoaD family protein
MKVKVRFFSIHKEIVGKSQQEIVLKYDSTTQSLIDSLTSKHPRLKKAEDYTVVSLNGKLVNKPMKLKDGDEVALFPPVGGG